MAPTQLRALRELDHLPGPEDVSAALGIPVPTLYRWRSQGKGPRAMRLGRHLRYRVEDVEAWLDEQALAAN